MTATIKEKKGLSRDQILKAEDLVTERVEVPEWGGFAIVRSLTGAERDQFEISGLRQKKGNIETDLGKMINFRSRLVSLTLVDDEGNRLFSNSDVELLSQKSASAINRIFEVSRKLSGLSEADVDDLEKNSEPGPSESSISG